MKFVKTGEETKKKKGLSQRGSGSFVPSLLNDSPFFEDRVPYNDKNVKENFPSKEDATYLEAVQQGDVETAQRMVEEAAKGAGYTRKMFHETNAENIHIFDISRNDHGANDSETPFGIFTKSSNKNIGLGDKQMALYVKAENTLYVKNREDVRSKIPALVPYYDKIAAIDEKYSAISKRLEDAEFGAIEEWLDRNPDE